MVIIIIIDVGVVVVVTCCSESDKEVISVIKYKRIAVHSGRRSAAQYVTTLITKHGYNDEEVDDEPNFLVRF